MAFDPDRFGPAIDLKTADLKTTKALGIDIPLTLPGRAAARS